MLNRTFIFIILANIAFLILLAYIKSNGFAILLILSVSYFLYNFYEKRKQALAFKNYQRTQYNNMLIQSIRKSIFPLTKKVIRNICFQNILSSEDIQFYNQYNNTLLFKVSFCKLSDFDKNTLNILKLNLSRKLNQKVYSLLDINALDQITNSFSYILDFYNLNSIAAFRQNKLELFSVSKVYETESTYYLFIVFHFNK